MQILTSVRLTVAMENPARAPEAESRKTKVAETSVENIVVQESVRFF